MDYNEIMGTPKAKKYESYIEMPTLTQGFQPLSPEDMNESPKEIPVYYEDEQSALFTLKQCVGLFLVQLLPVIGIVMDFIWAFDKTDSSPKKTVARGLLIVYGIVTVLLIAAMALTPGYKLF